jgi:plasmid stabilization system protein ParE
VALEVRWSGQARDAIRQIASFWLEQDRTKVRLVLESIYRRAGWLANGHSEVGTPIEGLPRSYRWFRDRTFGYKLFYRIETEGDVPARLASITIRHGRQRPLAAGTLRRYASPQR